MWQRKDLRKYQEGMVEFIKRVKRCGLFVDPGLGKTGTTLTAISEEIEDLNICGITLIVAPPRVARQTWPREFAEWAHLNDRSFVYVGGSVARRRKQLARRADFHIMSMDCMLWLLKELGGDYPRYEKNEEGDMVKVKGSKWKSPDSTPYSAIVVDESSKMKNSSTNRWRAMRMLAFKVEYFLILTGTPAANSLHDLWAQVYLLDGGQRLGHNITAFRDRWFREAYNGHGYEPHEHASRVIEGLISDIVFTLRETDYADLPPRMYNTIRVDLDEATQKKYNKFERTLILETELEDEKNIVANQGAALTQKLQQLANGVVYRTDSDEVKSEHVFHDAKLDAMESLVEELGGQTLLVAYQFKSDLKRIMKRFPQARAFDKSEETQNRWNRGEIEILCVHPRSAAHGLNLQHGGNNVLWFTPTWSLEDYIQLNKRLHRSGQKKPVMVHHLIAAGTIDEDVMVSIGKKDATQETLLNLLKARIRSYK